MTATLSPPVTTPPEPPTASRIRSLTTTIGVPLLAVAVGLAASYLGGSSFLAVNLATREAIPVVAATVAVSTCSASARPDGVTPTTMPCATRADAGRRPARRAASSRPATTTVVSTTLTDRLNRLELLRAVAEAYRADGIDPPSWVLVELEAEARPDEAGE